jgi:flagellar biosynthetic protein FliR
MELIWDLIYYNFIGCLLVFARVTGIFTFNPIFGRQNVPMRVRVLMSIVFAVCMLAGMGNTTGFIPTSVVHFVAILIFEALLGLVFGFVVNMILTALLFAGEVTDNQIGLAMAKVMDPGTGIQMPVFANLYYQVFILYFFVTGGHLEYIRLFHLSYEIIPIGFDVTFRTMQMAESIVRFFSVIMELALRLAMPIIAAELIIQACVGVIVKSVPTIQVFVVSIQLKILFGIIVLLAIAQPVSAFIGYLFNVMWRNLESLLYHFN